jgi:hypothetical protein
MFSRIQSGFKLFLLQDVLRINPVIFFFFRVVGLPNINVGLTGLQKERIA